MSETIQLTYLFDPLCGWCYGASPAIGKLMQQEGAGVFRVIIDADRVAKSLVQGRLNRTEEQRSGPSASIPALPGSGRTIADIDRRTISP